MSKEPIILILIPSLTIGGAEKQAVLIAQRIRRHKLGKPIIVGLGRPGLLEAQLLNEGIASKSLNMSFGFHLSSIDLWFRALSVRRELRALNPKLLIPLTFWPNVLSAFSCLGPFSPACMWNQRSIDTNLPFSKLEKISRQAVSFYSANSIAAGNFINARHKLKESNSPIILPNLISTQLEDFFSYKSSNVPIRMLMMANFFLGKRQDVVLQGLKCWEETQPESAIELVFSGKAPGGYFLEIIKAQAFDLNLKSKVKFCHYSSLTEALLEGVDVGILATDSEGYSNSIMEYMLAGLPVLVSDIPANREVLGEQTEHQLFGPTAAEFAQALQNLMDKKQNWDDMGKANREEILRRHSITAEEKWIQAIKKCLK